MTVTMDDVAARAGVSRAAVSLALRNSRKVSAARRQHILQVAAELGYRPNINASRLASASTGTIGVVFEDLHNALYAEILDGVAEELGGGPEQLMLATGFRHAAGEQSAANSFLSHRVDGLVLLGSQLEDDDIRRLAAEVPLVVAGRQVQGVDSVGVDDSTGAALATEHLIALGHRRIAHVDGGDGAGATLRRTSFLDTMRRHDLEDDAEVVGGDYTEKRGRLAAESLFRSERPPTAVFAANDLSAWGVLAAARAMGLDVPTELSVIGFDNVTITQFHFVGLSTIDYPRAQMGREVIGLLRNRIGDPERQTTFITLQPALVIGDTTAAAAVHHQT